jgi:ATP-dependent RNA helicase DDX42
MQVDEYGIIVFYSFTEPQVRSICNHVRPDRQTLLFSATFKKRIEKLARDVLNDPIRIVQGDVGEANQDVTQVVEVLPPNAKYNWLTSRLVDFMSSGSVLIFVTKKVFFYIKVFSNVAVVTKF